MTGRVRPAQWRSLEQLADTPEFRRFVEKEWPALRGVPSGPQRRSFLKLMAASFALAGLAGCDDPPDGRDEEVPYVNNPERMEPSAPLSYASIALLGGLANGVLVTTRNGRPIKIEGNQQHPWSRGGTDVFAQASVLDMYDPARSQSVRHLDEPSNWLAFQTGFAATRAQVHAAGGGGLRLLTGPISSPTVLAQIAAMREFFPGMHWHTHDPSGRDAAYEGARRAFGRPLETRWRFDRARVIVSLDGDFLDPGPQQVGVSRDWIAARRASVDKSLLALHSLNSVPNLTSAKADFAAAAAPADILATATALLAALRDPATPPSPGGDAWHARAAAALHANRGASLVVAGSTASPALQEAVHRLNAALGNIGHSVFYTQPALESGESLTDLVGAMSSGAVQTLVMIDANPVYDAPAGLGFADALQHVPIKIHAGLYVDETALRSDWHLPLAHPLEAWGDARSVDGTVGLMQPTIDPIFDGRSTPEILSLIANPQVRSGSDLIRAQWGADKDQAAWETALGGGFVPNSAFAEEQVTPIAASESGAPQPGPQGLTVVFRPDPTVWDGTAANNAWLQELPKPLTKLTWDNAVFVSPALAAGEQLAQGDVVTIAIGGRQADAPIWILPGQADGVLGVTLGYGRSVPGLLAHGLGYSAYALRGDQSWQADGATLTKTGRHVTFATTQDHNSMEGHDFVRIQVEGAPDVGETTSWTLPTAYKAPQLQSQGAAQWGMVIDLDACIGCNACVTACQSENNIAVVGREQVAMGREMHWLRVDRYYEGPVEAPKTHFQPIPCMHCEQAPCEVGCPVEATLHDSEGLNLMVYNRCVGTRACSSYCPYKVRHFNYFNYNENVPPSTELRNNPEVTVRARGVMEKCTYCVQRIETARIAADKANTTAIADGVVQTACQGACPTTAIIFGDLSDKGSAVAKARADGRNYALLGELNTRPRTSYLAERAPRRTEEAG